MKFPALLLPIVLILINTIASALKAAGSFWNIISFLGQPIVAVGIGLMVAILMMDCPFSREAMLHEMEKGMASAILTIHISGLSIGCWVFQKRRNSCGSGP